MNVQNFIFFLKFLNQLFHKIFADFHISSDFVQNENLCLMKLFGSIFAVLIKPPHTVWFTSFHISKNVITHNIGLVWKYLPREEIKINKHAAVDLKWHNFFFVYNASFKLSE